MKTLSINPNTIARSTVTRSWTIRRALLVCGVVSSLFYVVTLSLGAMRWEGYSATSQAISELFAIGAPTRSFIATLLVVYALLIYAFGLGIWQSEGAGRVLRAAAILIIGKEVFGVVATVVTPMHLRGMEANVSDTLHAAFTVVGVFLCMLPAMILGAVALGKRFRIFTIVIILIFFVAAVWTFSDAARIGANLPTPWLGIQERINAFSYMVWIAVLSITLLRAEKDSLRLEDREGIEPEVAANRT
jgi:hypothetical membrane protein